MINKKGVPGVTFALAKKDDGSDDIMKWNLVLTGPVRDADAAAAVAAAVATLVVALTVFPHHSCCRDCVVVAGYIHGERCGSAVPVCWRSHRRDHQVPRNVPVHGARGAYHPYLHVAVDVDV
jgi:hypothetical protein